MRCTRAPSWGIGRPSCTRRTARSHHRRAARLKVAVTKRRPEPTQPGNPHQLTLRQHVHSRACITRFADGAGRVLVRKHGGSAFLANADNDIFCAKRVWDQGSEANFFRKIEKAFQVEADRAISTGAIRNHSAFSAYFSIWHIRAALAAAPPEDLILNGLSPESYLTKAQEEILESKHAGYARGNVVLGRLAARLDAVRFHDMKMGELGDLGDQCWDIICSPERCGFICSDGPPSWRYIPLSPRHAAIGRAAEVERPMPWHVSAQAVHVINTQTVRDARVFVFGHPSDLLEHGPAA